QLDPEEMSRERQKYAEAEDFERVLAAQDRGFEYRPIERGPTRRHETHGQDGKREEVHQAHDVEIGLIDRIDNLAEPARHEVTIPREIPGHHDREGEHQVGNGKRRNDARADQTRDPLGSADPEPRADDKQKLPGERIEYPLAARISRDVPFER